MPPTHVVALVGARQVHAQAIRHTLRRAGEFGSLVLLNLPVIHRLEHRLWQPGNAHPAGDDRLAAANALGLFLLSRPNTSWRDKMGTC